MSLRAKVISFIIVAVIGLALVTLGNTWVRARAAVATTMDRDVQVALQHLLRARVDEQAFFKTGHRESSDQVGTEIGLALKELEHAKTLAGGDRSAEQLDRLEQALTGYREAFGQVIDNVTAIFEARAKQLAAGQKLLDNLTALVVEPLTQKEGELFIETGEGLDDYHKNFRTEAKDLAALMSRFILAGQALYLNDQEDKYQAFQKQQAKDLKIIETNAANILPNLKFPELKLTAAWKEIDSLGREVRQQGDALYQLWKKNGLLSGQLNQSAEALSAKAGELGQTMGQKVRAAASLALWLGLAVALIAGLILVALGVYLLSSTFRPLRTAVDALVEVSTGVADASEQSRRSSDHLATGAGDQAASLEETSASLEEVTSMTKQNAENADQAKMLMDQSQDLVARSGQSMTEMSRAMDEIADSSQQISKIIKTIDEIAFQTNLLALNAAVEAARAGEAGAGFAVVADEVRSLAMRAAEAAKSTQDLIQDALGKVNNGVTLVRQTETQFGEMTESSQKTASLVREIAEASQEQRLGLEQISQAVSNVDQVTQQNAGEAGEGAEAAGRLQEQAGVLNVVVDDLMNVLNGRTRIPGKTGRARREPKTRGGILSRLGRGKRDRQSADTLLLPEA